MSPTGALPLTGRDASMEIVNAADYIRELDLQPHPEGGYFRETYRSGEKVAGSGLPARYGGERAVSTGIYFLLTGDTFSAFHRLRSDEIWHFYAGDPVRVHLLHGNHQHEEVVVGPQLERGQTFQLVIPAGCWFAARVEKPDGFTLVGCTVAPGFDFADFELAEREQLAAAHPAHRELIASFTRS